MLFAEEEPNEISEKVLFNKERTIEDDNNEEIRQHKDDDDIQSRTGDQNELATALIL